MWLRPSPDGELTDYTTGAQAGPTCFHEGADGVSDPDHRLIGTICQTPHTTVRTLIAPAEGGALAWTPETTTGEDWLCLNFDQEVRA